MPSYVVAGASRGLGFEFVRTLSANSANVVFGLYRSEGSAAKLLALAKEKGNVHAIRADIAKIADLKAAAEAVSKVTGGKLDVLINNAVYTDESTAWNPITSWAGNEEGLEKELTTSFQVNVIGPILTTNIFLPLLRAGTTKKILNLSSGLSDSDVISKLGWAVPSYAMSKSGLNSATTSFAVALKGEGIVVLALSPGFVNTRETAPTEAEMAAFGKMAASFKQVFPDWNGVPDAPEHSVGLCLDLLDKATLEQSGQFLSHYGNKRWL